MNLIFYNIKTSLNICFTVHYEFLQIYIRYQYNLEIFTYYRLIKKLQDLIITSIYHDFLNLQDIRMTPIHCKLLI